MAFDRLIRAVDQWAGLAGRHDVFAQIGPAGYQPVNLRHERFLEPDRFRSVFQEAALVVAHAGMGSIITALEMAKPILIMPRRGDLGETRNDHQVATARRFAGRDPIHVAMDEVDLSTKLDELASQIVLSVGVSSAGQVSAERCFMQDACRNETREWGLSSQELLDGIRAFIRGIPVASIVGPRSRCAPVTPAPAEPCIHVASDGVSCPNKVDPRA